MTEYRNHGGQSVGEIIQASQQDECRECGELVTFDVLDGELVALDPDTWEEHRHRTA